MIRRLAFGHGSHGLGLEQVGLPAGRVFSANIRHRRDGRSRTREPIPLPRGNPTLTLLGLEGSAGANRQMRIELISACLHVHPHLRRDLRFRQTRSVVLLRRQRRKRSQRTVIVFRPSGRSERANRNSHRKQRMSHDKHSAKQSYMACQCSRAIAPLAACLVLRIGQPHGRWGFPCCMPIRRRQAAFPLARIISERSAHSRREPYLLQARSADSGLRSQFAVRCRAARLMVRRASASSTALRKGLSARVRRMYELRGQEKFRQIRGAALSLDLRILPRARVAPELRIVVRGGVKRGRVFAWLGLGLAWMVVAGVGRVGAM